MDKNKKSNIFNLITNLRTKYVCIYRERSGERKRLVRCLQD